MIFTNFEIIVIIALSIFIIISIILTIKIVTTLKSINSMLTDLRKDLIPNLRKLSTTLDIVNSELGGIDKIITTIFSITKRIDTTAKFGQEMIYSPISKIVGILAGVSKAVSKMKSGENKE